MTGHLSQRELESYLWGAATLLRGLVDASDYKQYIADHLIFQGHEVVHLTGPGQAAIARPTPGARRTDDGLIVYPESEMGCRCRSMPTSRSRLVPLWQLPFFPGQRPDVDVQLHHVAA